MQIEHIAVNNLRPYERNSRTHSDAQVEQIVTRWEQFTGRKAELAV